MPEYEESSLATPLKLIKRVSHQPRTDARTLPVGIDATAVCLFYVHGRECNETGGAPVVLGKPLAQKAAFSSERIQK